MAAAMADPSSLYTTETLLHGIVYFERMARLEAEIEALKSVVGALQPGRNAAG